MRKYEILTGIENEKQLDIDHNITDRHLLCMNRSTHGLVLFLFLIVEIQNSLSLLDWFEIAMNFELNAFLLFFLVDWNHQMMEAL